MLTGVVKLQPRLAAQVVRHLDPLHQAGSALLAAGHVEGWNLKRRAMPHVVRAVGHSIMDHEPDLGRDFLRVEERVQAGHYKGVLALAAKTLAAYVDEVDSGWHFVRREIEERLLAYEEMAVPTQAWTFNPQVAGSVEMVVPERGTVVTGTFGGKGLPAASILEGAQLFFPSEMLAMDMAQQLIIQRELLHRNVLDVQRPAIPASDRAALRMQLRLFSIAPFSASDAQSVIATFLGDPWFEGILRRAGATRWNKVRRTVTDALTVQLLLQELKATNPQLARDVEAHHPPLTPYQYTYASAQEELKRKSTPASKQVAPVQNL